jgi:putative membrane protein
MKRTFTTAAAAAAVWALMAVPGIAQSSGSGSSSSGSNQQGGGASGSGATDQQGSTHGGQVGSGTTDQSGSGQSGTDGQSGTGQGSGSGSGSSGTTGGATAGSTGQGSAAGGSSAATASSQDRTFIMEAAAGGLAEVQLGRLASQKASRSEVKEFGQMMVTDHTRANDQLMKIAQSKGVTTPPSLKPDHKAAQDHLSKLSGEAFDRAYMQHMVKDHQKDVALFRKQSTGASDAEVKQFASATLPTLQKHLQRAQEIEQIVGGGSPRGTSGSGSGSGASGSGVTPPR